MNILDRLFILNDADTEHGEGCIYVETDLPTMTYKIALIAINTD